MRSALVAALGAIVLAQQPAPAVFEHDASRPGARVAAAHVVAQAPPQNAETLVRDALGRAKKEQKVLFLWFSAPG